MVPQNLSFTSMKEPPRTSERPNKHKWILEKYPSSSEKTTHFTQDVWDNLLWALVFAKTSAILGSKGQPPSRLSLQRRELSSKTVEGHHNRCQKGFLTFPHMEKLSQPEARTSIQVVLFRSQLLKQMAKPVEAYRPIPSSITSMIHSQALYTSSTSSCSPWVHSVRSIWTSFAVMCRKPLI